MADASIRRRGHGEDAIYFAADKNRYIGAVSVGFGPDGKRLRRKVSGKTKQEVRDKLRALHAELNVGLQSSAGYTVRAAVEDWLEHGPYLVVQVVPEANGANAGLGGAFDIAGADGMPDTLRMEGVEDQTIEKRSLVRKAAVAFDRVRADALPRAASHDLILRLADELWKI